MSTPSLSSMGTVRGIPHAGIHGCPVLPTVALCARILVRGPCYRPHEGWRIQLCCHLQRQAEILVGKIYHESGCQVVFENFGRIRGTHMPLTSNSAKHDLAGLLWVQATLLRHGQAFRRQHVESDRHVVVDDLHAFARAGWATMNYGVAKLVKQWPGTLHMGLLAANHDQQLALLSMPG